MTKDVQVPTYEQDIVGDIRRWDERDILFARKDFFRYFGTDTPEYKAYYEAHPEYLEYDTKVGNSPAWGERVELTLPCSRHSSLQSRKLVPSPLLMGRRLPTELRSHRLCQSTPDFPTLLATAKGYAMGAWVSIQLAECIRMLGHSARAHHLNNYRVIAVPVAVDCGLGELARSGYLITRELGLGVRLAIVTTDMPLAHDKPVDIGAQSFCEHCKICAEECPVGAIPTGDKVGFNGVKRWKLDEQKCYRYWHAVGTDCGICMTSCPLTKPRNWFYKPMSWLATIKGAHQLPVMWAFRLFSAEFKSAPRPDFIDPCKRQDLAETK